MMNIPVVKSLVEVHTIEDLRKAEDALIDDQPLPFEVAGRDEGEKLTHLLAAIYILERMKTDGTEFTAALRDYTRRVREAIS